MKIRSRILLVVAFLILLAVVGGVAYRTAASQSQYRARARLLVRAEPPAIMLARRASDGSDREVTRFQRTQAALVKSQLVLNSALIDNNVRRSQTITTKLDPIAWLGEHITAEFVDGSEVMEISLSGDNPVEIAVIVNAVKKAYMDEVVNVDTKRRADRYAKLRAIKDNYADILHERRARLSQAQGSFRDDDARAGLMQVTLTTRYVSLRDKRVQLRMERAEAETLLARRKQSAVASAEAMQKEIAQLQDKVAVLTAHQKVLDEELAHVMSESTSTTITTPDVRPMLTEIAQLEETSRKVSDELEALSIELQAPPRVRTIEDAVPPVQRKPWGIAALVSRQ
jgi:capsular polysaccharide biosynthesis protein